MTSIGLDEEITDPDDREFKYPMELIGQKKIFAGTVRGNCDNGEVAFNGSVGVDCIRWQPVIGKIIALRMVDLSAQFRYACG